MSTSPAADTPAAHGYAMPAEWAPHAGTWISWPHNPETWPGRLEGAEAAMAAAVVALTVGETVHVNVLDEAHEAQVSDRVQTAGANMASVRFHHIATDDAWCRDHGAIFVTRAGAGPLAAVDFGFNAWGGKYPPWDRDDAVAGQMARTLAVPHFRCDMVLEGGSIEVNGAGALITTEQCLLNPNRNPQLRRGDIEQRLRDYLGVSQIIWLGEGIVGDDTDGHVDDITRFVSRTRIITAVAKAGERNHEALEANRRTLMAQRLQDGSRLEVLELPMPCLDDEHGEPLPASYANFYIANQIVLMPAYGDENDEAAAQRIGGCFPGRRMCPIDCRDLVHGLGAFHCLTQQIPQS